MDDRLTYYNLQKTREYALEIVFVTIVSLLGVVGNSVALLFYRRRKNHNTSSFLLTVLFWNDLISSFVNLFQIYESTNSVTYTSDILCKIHGFLLHTFTGNSVALLIPIAFDRFSKVVFVFSAKKFTKKKAKISVFVFITFSVLLAIPQLLLFSESRQINIEVEDGNAPLQGHRCLFNSDSNKVQQNIFHILDIVIIIISVIILGGLYGAIPITMMKLRKNHAVSARTNRLQLPHVETGMSSIEDQSFNDVHTDNSTQVYFIECQKKIRKDQSGSKGLTLTSEQATGTRKLVEPVEKRHTKKSSPIPRKRRFLQNKAFQLKLTAMTFVITVASLLSCFGYFYVRIGYKVQDHELSVGLKILVRTIIFNSTINPYVICLFSTEFRKFVQELFVCKCLRSGE
ncbi:neuropeptide FF receptor 2-like [Mya arenaria]|uniref:neuropeptide FF receptor 2-like n=1 Tax=Mya arenaria TaxID=6604 RepID=UPI0022E7FE39|nr:neuropeptide FF receptor 2-like [Mya arenaria]